MEEVVEFPRCWWFVVENEKKELRQKKVLKSANQTNRLVNLSIGFSLLHLFCSYNGAIWY